MHFQAPKHKLEESEITQPGIFGQKKWADQKKAAKKRRKTHKLILPKKKEEKEKRKNKPHSLNYTQ